MEIFLKILFLAVIGSLIGWITNVVAIKMLFKPVKPVKILFFEIQGVFPKRQNAIAKSLGKVVEKELIGMEDLKASLLTKENVAMVKEKLKGKLEKTIKENIPQMFLAMVGGQISQIIEKFTKGEDDFLKELFNDVMSSGNGVNISKIVEDKVNKMDFAMFEQILLELISKELKHIEYIGAVLGLLIGVVQGLILIFL